MAQVTSCTGESAYCTHSSFHDKTTTNLAPRNPMFSTRSLLLASALALPVIACGSSDNTTNGPPEGTHYGYVVSKAQVIPELGHQAAELSLDVGSSKSSKLDGRIDNQLGIALLTLTNFFDVQGTIDDAVNTGGINLLIDFQTKDFINSSNVGFA